MSRFPAGSAPTTWTIVVAAGTGSRFGGHKQYEALGSERVLDHALRAARAVSDGIVLVVGPDQIERHEPAADVVVAGGDTRSASTRAGLAAVPGEAELILVHDGARPLADAALFERVVAALVAGGEAVVPVVDLVDTVRSRTGGPVDRSSLVAVQTPQGFRAEMLRRAHAEGGDATDDASLVEAIGGKVVLVDGAPENLKLTRRADLVLAEALLAEATS